MRPGADNGGAKILTLEILRRAARLAPSWELVLLTPEICHDELAELDGDNTTRLCILPRPAGDDDAVAAGSGWRAVARGLAARLPPRVARHLVDLYWSVAFRPGRTTIVDELEADLLFNPFTAPFHRSRRVPSVSIVYDLQFAAYPEFFSAEERHGRALHARDACAGERVVCISDFVRRDVETRLGVAGDRLVVIPIQLATRLPRPDDDATAATLSRHSLTAGRFLLYPANFWPHKNHRMLLVAVRQLQARRPRSDLVLVCTGQPGEAMRELAAEARQMGLDAHCRFPGFVSEVELAALLASCRALIFPSLYEGFGMPILEAMEADCPVLCSDRTALPEIGADAVLLFDPRRPAAIADAIERIDDDDALRADLIRRGRRRRRDFADPTAMAERYLTVFAELMKVESPFGARR